MGSVYNYLDHQLIRSLTNKYNVPGNLLHEQQVCHHALQVFDFLTAVSIADGTQYFGEQQPADGQYLAISELRDLLEVAALLHDLGHFINQKKHDYHTYHIIANDYLLYALPKKLKVMLALIAGGHRKKIHFQQAELQTELQTELKANTKKIVRKLTAILRVADAIDYTRQHNLKISDIRIVEQQLTLAMNDVYAVMVAERVQKKSALFQEVYGLNVSLRALV